MPQGLAIAVASHKPYWMPPDGAYLPVWVGAALRTGAAPAGFSRDDAGDNISARNPSFCELTALYWAWKNVDARYLGLAHYRRHFAGRRLGGRHARVATGPQLEAALAKAPIVLPKKRDYVIETTWQQYVHAHHEQDLIETRSILSESHPDCLQAWDSVMARTSGHRFNMLVMRRDLLDAYCAWLFDVLLGLERRLDTTGYDAYDQRVYGFVAERLLDVWILANGVEYTELPVVHLESQKWPKKIARFLMRKLRG